VSRSTALLFGWLTLSPDEVVVVVSGGTFLGLSSREPRVGPCIQVLLRPMPTGTMPGGHWSWLPDGYCGIRSQRPFISIVPGGQAAGAGDASAEVRTIDNNARRASDIASSP
jgi:hypothetical protein